MRPDTPPIGPEDPTPSNRPNDPSIDPNTVSERPSPISEHSTPGFSSVSRTSMASYSRTLRACDRAVLDEFKGLQVWLPDGSEKNVPIIWGPQEKAVAIALSDAIDKENIRIDRIKLPMLAISSGDISFAPERFTYHQNFRWLQDPRGNYAYGAEKRYGDTVYGKSRGLPVDKNYTLYAWTRYIEDMNQVVEQIMLKFAPIVTLNVEGVHWEVVLKLDSVNNSISPEIGDAAIRIVKYEFAFHAETYISRGYIRGKTVFDIYAEMGLGSGEDFEQTDEIIDKATDEEIDNLRGDT